MFRDKNGPSNAQIPGVKINKQVTVADPIVRPCLIKVRVWVHRLKFRLRLGPWFYGLDLNLTRLSPHLSCDQWWGHCFNEEQVLAVAMLDCTYKPDLVIKGFG